MTFDRCCVFTGGGKIVVGCDLGRTDCDRLGGATKLAPCRKRASSGRIVGMSSPGPVADRSYWPACRPSRSSLRLDQCPSIRRTGTVRPAINFILQITKPQNPRTRP